MGPAPSRRTRGALLDVGGSAQLTATATDAEGNVVSGMTFMWSSSNPDVVTVVL